MNILVVSSIGLYRDPSVSFVHAQAAAYAALGHRVRSLILLPVGKRCCGSRFFPSVQMVQQDGVELCYLRCVSLSNFGVSWFNTPSALLALRVNFSKIVDGFTPDVIHAHALGGTSEAGAYLKRKLGCPLVVTTHGGDTFAPLQRGDHTFLSQCANKADRVVAVSTLLKNLVSQCTDKPPVSVILNGFRLNNIAYSDQKKPFSIIQAGYLIPRKKADITIRAFAELQRQYPGATLEIVGSGSEMERFQALCRELSVERSVHFHGFLPNADVLAEMGKAQFFCMPSVDEGFGIVYLEAMASGCITIGTEGEGIADLIVHGVNGFLVPPDDPEAIVRVIDWCIQNPEQAGAIARQGCRDALNLTWQHNAQQYIKLFEEIIK